MNVAYIEGDLEKTEKKKVIVKSFVGVVKINETNRLIREGKIIE